MGSSTDLPTGTSSLRTTSPPTDRVTGAVPPAGSSMRNLVMTSRPTTPKRGDCSSTISRSRSLFLPAIRACKGAAPSSGGSPAGTSCTWPSVSRTTPASRSGGTSTSAERMVSIRRVPPGRSLPSWMCDGGSTASRTSSPSCWPSLRFERLARRLDLRAALADRHRIGIVDHHQRHVGDRLPLLLDQRRVAERGQHDHQRAQPPHRAARAGAQAEQHQHQADAAQHGQHRPAEQGIEGDGDGGGRVHRRSLCMMSGMWTMSSL